MAHNARKQYEHVIYSLFHAAHVHLESGMTVKTLFLSYFSQYNTINA